MNEIEQKTDRKAVQCFSTAANRNRLLRNIRKLSDVLILANCFLVLFITNDYLIWALIIFQVLLVVVNWLLFKHEMKTSAVKPHSTGN